MFKTFKKKSAINDLDLLRAIFVHQLPGLLAAIYRKRFFCRTLGDLQKNIPFETVFFPPYKYVNTVESLVTPYQWHLF